MSGHDTTRQLKLIARFKTEANLPCNRIIYKRARPRYFASLELQLSWLMPVSRRWKNRVSALEIINSKVDSKRFAERAPLTFLFFAFNNWTMFLGSLFKCHFPTLSAFLDEIEVYRQFLRSKFQFSDIPIIVTTTMRH